VLGDGIGLLTYGLEKPDALAKYVFEFIFDLLGLPSKEATDARCAVYYGDRRHAPAGALVIPYCESDLIWPNAPTAGQVANPSDTVFPFDVVNSIRRLLTDEVNRNLKGESCDEHQRLRFATSFQGRHGIGELPLVNTYAKALGAWLTRHLHVLPIPAWPEGRRCAIGLSHDVDRVARRSKTLFWPPYAVNLSKYENLMAARQRLWHLRQMARSPMIDDVALFKQLIAFEADLTCSSTFFFAARNRFAVHASILDVQYDVTNRRMRRLLEELRQKKFGVGLHASYRAFEEPRRFAEERQLLQRVSGAEVAGLRHHFWHLGLDVDATLAAHEVAGFDYDSSIAFNEHLGFRRSVAWPYYPWNDALQRPLTTLQLPVCCMDGNVFYSSSSVDDGVDRIWAIITRIKEVGGVGVIDWHSDTASPATQGYREWGEAYERLVYKLAGDSEVWVTNLEAILDWFKSRRNRLSRAIPGEPALSRHSGE
jgi:hypothetical protein